jgi:hypothetical protein
MGNAVSASVYAGFSGDPGGSRTPNPQIRSLMLYPVELRGRDLSTAERRRHARRNHGAIDVSQKKSLENLGWETGIEPATVGATVRCSAS